MANPGTMTGTGLPAWLVQVLPPWFAARPAFTEAVWSSAQSAGFGMSILIVAAWQVGAFATFALTVYWVESHWWALVTAGAIAIWRGKSAASKSSAAYTSQNGISKA